MSQSWEVISDEQLSAMRESAQQSATAAVRANEREWEDAAFGRLDEVLDEIERRRVAVWLAEEEEIETSEHDGWFSPEQWVVLNEAAARWQAGQVHI